MKIVREDLFQDLEDVVDLVGLHALFGLFCLGSRLLLGQSFFSALGFFSTEAFSAGFFSVPRLEDRLRGGCAYHVWVLVFQSEEERSWVLRDGERKKMLKMTGFHIYRSIVL